MEDRMCTVAFELPGYRITRSLGVVRGITVRSRSVFGTLGAALQTLAGGNISLLTELCEKSRAEAFELMLTHANEMGANAIVAVRYDATEVMQGVTEVLCYGTAVTVAAAMIARARTQARRGMCGGGRACRQRARARVRASSWRRPWCPRPRRLARAERTPAIHPARRRHHGRLG